MRKILILVSFAFLISDIYAQEDTLEVKSDIKEVTVFLEGAQIIRKAKMNLPKGSHKISLIKLSQYLDPKSVQVKSSSNLTILSVKHQINYFQNPEKTTEIKNLEKRKKELEFEIKNEQTILSVYKQEEDLLLRNKKLAGSKKALKIEELKQAAELFRERLTEIKTKQLEINKKIDQYNKEKNKIRNQLSSLNATKEEPTSEIVVSVTANSDINAKFDINYAVSRAGWKAKYDIRAKDISKPIELNYKADIFQQTGYDWKNVKLTLSTGNPAKSGDKPQLATWFLNFYNPHVYRDYDKIKESERKLVYKTVNGAVTGRIIGDDGMPLPGVTVQVKGTSVATMTGPDGYYSIDVPEGTKSMIFSYIGMESYEKAITGNRQDIVMSPGDVALDEVVVTSYGVSRSKGKIGGKNKKKDKKKSEGEKQINKVEEKQTSIEFLLEKPYTIPSDKKDHSVDVRKYMTKAKFNYFCVPKIEEKAYLVARIFEWEQYNMLSGKTNLFFEGTYVGSSFMDVNNTEDTLKVSMGRDNDIAITRELLKDYTKKQILSNKKVETYAYEIAVRNKKNKAIDIVVEDQFPQSAYNDITVEHIELSGAEYDKDTGKLKWKMSLKPSETKKLIIKYSVKYPRNKVINIK